MQKAEEERRAAAELEDAKAVISGTSGSRAVPGAGQHYL